MSQGSISEITFRTLKPADLEMLHDWLCRPHVSEWWGQAPSWAEMEIDYLPMTCPESSTRGYIASLEGRPIGFVQSYTVLLDPSVSKVQADPSPNNERSIRSYLRAGFRHGSVDTPDGPAVLMICGPQLDADSVDWSLGLPAR